MTYTCDVCDQSDWIHYLKSDFLIQCSYCGLVRANLSIPLQELESYYQHNYYFGDEYVDYLRDRPAIELNFRYRIKDLHNRHLLTPDTALIEIGSAFGFFLNLIKSKVSSHLGYDVTKEGVIYAQKELGVNVICGDFLTYAGPKTDLICMWDVIEHLGNPKAFIQKCNQSLRPHGHLVFTTGDIDSYMARIQGDRWRLIHPPTHMFYFTKATITRLLQSCGFTVTSITYPPVYRNLGSIVKQLFDITWNTSMVIGINTFDIMQVIARKN